MARKPKPTPAQPPVQIALRRGREHANGPDAGTRRHTMDDKLVTLVRRLAAKAGDVSWGKTEEEETFETDLAGFGVQIGRAEADGEEPLYTVRLFDTEGE